MKRNFCWMTCWVALAALMIAPTTVAWAEARKDEAKRAGRDLRKLTKGPLAKRMTVTKVSVEAQINLGSGYDNPSSFWEGTPLRPVIFAPQPDGGAKIAWTDNKGAIHITPVNKKFQRCGDDRVIQSGLLRDVVAHDDGSALLVLQNGGMMLYRFRGKETVFGIRLVGNYSSAMHMGTVAFNGEKYATYFGVHDGGHEGDALRFVSPKGQILAGGWGWGVSHSIDMRVALAGKKFMPLALSDAYPGTGIWFNHSQKRVSYVWGDFSGSTGGRIGGITALGDRMYVAFSSKEGGRSHWSAALADFAQKSPHEQKIHKYVHDSKTDQVNVKIARYGNDRLMLSWLEKGTWEREFQLYDADGKPTGEMEILPVRASARADMVTLANGDVVWAHTWGKDKRVLKIVRIASPPAKKK